MPKLGSGGSDDESEDDTSSESQKNLDTLIELKKEEIQKQEIRRVQRAHLIVALAVVSAFVSLYNPPEGGLQFSVFLTSYDPVYALLFNAAIMAVYIPVHLFLVTIRPMAVKTSFDSISDLALPFINLLFLLGSAPLVLMSVTDINFPSLVEIPIILNYDIWCLKPINSKLGQMFVNPQGLCTLPTLIHLELITPISYIIGEITIGAYPAYQSAKGFDQTMTQIRTNSTADRLHVKSGLSGETGRITIHNDGDDTLSGNDIEIWLDAPRGISTEVGQAIEKEPKDGKDVYRLVDGLDPDEEIHVPVDISRIPGCDLTSGEVQAEVYIQGEKESEEALRF